MIDFEVQRSTRRCAETDRPFEPGEPFYSVLVTEGSEVVRYDYCQQAWQGPPDDALGWWKTSMPSPDAGKMHWAPSDVILHYFEQIEGCPEKEDVRYVLALLMVRRRIARLQTSEFDEAHRESLVLYCPRNESEHRVKVAPPEAGRLEAIQAELAQLLFGEPAAGDNAA